MSIWEWDFLDKAFPGGEISVDDSDTLPLESISYKITRNKNYNIQLEISHSKEIDFHKNRMKGEIFTDTSYANLSSILDIIEIKGILPIKNTVDLSSKKERPITTLFEIENIIIHPSSDLIENNVVKVIDYIANIPKSYIWCDTFSEEEEHKKIRTYNTSDDLVFTENKKQKNISRSCITLIIDGIDVIIGKHQNSTLDSAGYIAYFGNPNSETRNKIRESISFAFGCPLIYFSSVFYSELGNLVKFEATSPETAKGLFWDSSQSPPAPITTNLGRTNYLDKILIQRIVNNIYINYYKYNLNYLIWKLKYAEISPYFMKPAYYGALIEGIQREYISAEKEKINNKLIEKTEYNKFSKIIKKLLSRKIMNEDVLKIFFQKIDNGNVAPQRLISDRFFQKLNLSTGEIENKSWSKRNDAAHGNNTSKEDNIDYIKQTFVLKILLNRIILNLIDGSDYYIDYYNFKNQSVLLSKALSESDHCSI